MTDHTALLAPWDGPHGLPATWEIDPADFEPAFDAAMAAHLAEIEAICADPAEPDFGNTIEALERAGQPLTRVATLFFTLSGGNTTPALQAVERTVSPRLATHRMRILMNPALWARVSAVPGKGLDGEQARVLELARRRFRRAGADLSEADRGRMRQIGARLAEIGTEFAQNVLADEQDWTMTLDDDALSGLPEFLVESAREEGEARDAGAPVITLSRSSVEPFLATADRRDLREIAWRAWTSRGAHTNWPLIAETLALRIERAHLLGFETFAAFKLEPEMAKTPEAVRDLLMRVWQPARTRAEADAVELAAMAAERGHNGPLEGWDWRYWAQRRRRARFDIDDAAVKPYLPLDGVIEAAFDVAGRLFGLSFIEERGVALPHRDARAWTVHHGGEQIGIFVGDYFARSSKRSGAWASAICSQQKLWSPGQPIILNTMNFAKGSPTLLSLDDARTLFHEFGHALHGLLSDVTFPSISGTAVARDFVELPSQLYEHWLTEPRILERHARHYRTGAPMPADLIAALRAADTIDQPFATVEYLGSALVDLEMHSLTSAEGLDPADLERSVLAGIGMPPAVGMRHRCPHFLHVFAGDGYSAGYYSYMWSEVMDADAFRAFEETGDPFDPATARRLAEHVLSAGGRQEAAEAYVGFRGHMPGVDAMLEGRGLAGSAAPAGA